MIKVRQLALGAVLMLTIISCGNSEEPASVASATSGYSSNSLFDYVPFDSPYLIGNLEPIGDDVINTFLARAQPALDAIQDELSLGLEALNEEAATSDDDVEQMAAKVMSALLQELDGNLNRDGLESLGFDLQSQKVVYGMGVFPVMRLGLSDADTLRATVQRVLDNAGITATEQEHQGVKYWRLANDDASEQPVAGYVAILTDHLAIGMLPAVAEDEMLPAFLGQSMPGNSNAAQRLQQLNAAHDYTPLGSGILDLEKMFAEVVDTNSSFARTIASSGQFSMADLSSQCIQEVQTIIGNTPRLTIGTTELTTSAVGIQYRVETRQSLAQDLMGLVSSIPLADPLSRKLLEFSFGIKVGALRDFLRSQMTAILETPYQCEHLLKLNANANEAFAALNKPLPPLVNNVKGIRASLTNFPMDDNFPGDAQGLVALHVEKPQMFVGMAQMFLPDFADMQLTAGDPPVQIPESTTSIPGLITFAALSDDAIGMSIGDGEEVALPGFLAQRPESDGTFFSISYDTAAYLEMTDRLTDQFDQGTDYPDSDQQSDSDLALPFERIGKASQQAFKDAVDRSHATFRFTSEGFVADSTMTFK